MAKEARVGRRGLGGVPVMRAARGWASVVDRGLRWPRRCLGTFRPFGRSAMSARVTERIGWGRGARGAYRSVRSRVGRVWERGMGSCEVGAIRYGSRVFYGRDLLGRILGSESRSYLGVEIGSRVEIVSRFRCVDFSRFVEVTSCLNSRLIKFGSIVFFLCEHALVSCEELRRWPLLHYWPAPGRLSVELQRARDPSMRE